VWFLLNSFVLIFHICSATVFGVSTESMKLLYDKRGNIVPKILLLMQEHLYAQGGLQVHSLSTIFINFSFTCHKQQAMKT